MRAHLHGWLKHARRIDVGVAMNLAELKKLCAFKSRNQTQHARLFAITQMILKADHAVRVSHQVLLTQLYRRVRLATVARIDQTDRLHGSVAQSVNTAAREFFDRQTRFEPARLFEALEWDAVRFNQSFVETRVLFFVKRTVEIIVAAFAIASGAKGNCLIYRISRDDRRDGVVEIHLVVAGQFHDLPRQGIGSERTGGDDRDYVTGNRGDFFADDLNLRIVLDALGNVLSKLLTVDGQSRARGHTGRGRGCHHQRAPAPQFFFQKIRRSAEL